MAKVLVQLVLSTVNAEGENHRLNSVVDMPVKSGIDPAQNMQIGIGNLMSDESKTLSLPVGNGHVSVRGSAIEWVYCGNVPEKQPIGNEVNLADPVATPDTPPQNFDVVPKRKKSKSKV